MKKQWKRIGAFVLALLMVVQIFASDSFSMTVDAAGSKLAISHKAITLVTGQSKTLKVTGATKTIKWSTSNKKVATVNKKGKVTAKKAGKATIKAKVGKYQLSCKVTVKKVELNKNKLDLGVKDTATLKVLHNKKKVVWSSSNKKVVTVNKKGKLTAKKAGKATIKAKVGKTTYKCVVTVKNNNKSKKDANGTYKYSYKPEAKVDELKKEKKYTVTEVPDGVQVVIKKDSKTKQVESGDVIVLPDSKGNPYVAMKVDTVRNTGSQCVYTGDVADYTDVFEKIDVDFNKQENFDGFEFNRQVVSSVVKSTGTTTAGAKSNLVSANGVSFSGTLSDTKFVASVGGNGITLTVTGNNGATGNFTLSNPKIDADIDVDVNGTSVKANKIMMTATEELDSDFTYKGKIKDSKNGDQVQWYLGHKIIPIKAGFMADVSLYLKMNLSGEFYVDTKTTATVGFNYQNQKMQPVNKMKFNVENAKLDIAGSMLLNPRVGLRFGGWWSDEEQKAVMEVAIVQMEGSVGPGMKATIQYHSTKPKVCEDYNIWLFAEIHLSDYGIQGLLKKLKVTTAWTLLDNNKSNPYRFNWHVEDGKKVNSCTFGKDDKKDVAGGTGTESELNDNWKYALDKTNKTVNLVEYIGTSPDVVVHGSYLVEGQKYGTELTSIEHRGADGKDKYSTFYNNRNIKSVKIEQGVFSRDTSDMFSSCSGLTNVDVSGLDTSMVTDMGGMFAVCGGLTNLDVSGFDTSKVADMEFMFYACCGLTNLDVSGFDTSKVTSMRGMFKECCGLTSLDVSGFDTSEVTSMRCMFEECSELTNLDVSGFDTSKVTDMGGMFSCCDLSSGLDVSGFDTSKVTNMGQMFCWCSELTNLDLSGFDTSQVTDMGYMFQNCFSLTTITVSSLWVTDQAKTTDMFINCGTDHVTYL